jgi:hypothetical protein
VLGIRIRIDPHHFVKQDLDPHPDPDQSEKQDSDPDPHQSAKVKPWRVILEHDFAKVSSSPFSSTMDSSSWSAIKTRQSRWKKIVKKYKRNIIQ